MTDDISTLEILVDLSERGEIKQTPRQIKRMSNTRREQILAEYQQSQLDETNEFLADIVIVKFEEILKNLSLIKPGSSLASKLQNRTMFKKDIKRVVGYFTPLLPFVGLIEGVVLTSSEIIENFNDDSLENKENNEDNTYDSTKRKESSSFETSSEHNTGQDT